MSARLPGRRRYRNDPRPRIAQVAADYASMWACYVQWDVQRRVAIAAGVDTASTDAYFEQQMGDLAAVLWAELKGLAPDLSQPAASEPAGETRSTLDKA